MCYYLRMCSSSSKDVDVVAYNTKKELMDDLRSYLGVSKAITLLPLVSEACDLVSDDMKLEFTLESDDDRNLYYFGLNVPILKPTD